jgi:hypothetical protein
MNTAKFDGISFSHTRRSVCDEMFGVRQCNEKTLQATAQTSCSLLRQVSHTDSDYLCARRLYGSQADNSKKRKAKVEVRPAKESVSDDR